MAVVALGVKRSFAEMERGHSFLKVAPVCLSLEEVIASGTCAKIGRYLVGLHNACKEKPPSDKVIGSECYRLLLNIRTHVLTLDEIQALKPVLSDLQKLLPTMAFDEVHKDTSVAMIETFFLLIEGFEKVKRACFASALCCPKIFPQAVFPEGKHKKLYQRPDRGGRGNAYIRAGLDERVCAVSDRTAYYTTPRGELGERISEETFRAYEVYHHAMEKALTAIHHLGHGCAVPLENITRVEGGAWRFAAMAALVPFGTPLARVEKDAPPEECLGKGPIASEERDFWNLGTHLFREVTGRDSFWNVVSEALGPHRNELELVHHYQAVSFSPRFAPFLTTLFGKATKRITDKKEYAQLFLPLLRGDTQGREHAFARPRDIRERLDFEGHDGPMGACFRALQQIIRGEFDPTTVAELFEDAHTKEHTPQEVYEGVKVFKPLIDRIDLKRTDVGSPRMRVAIASFFVALDRAWVGYQEKPDRLDRLSLIQNKLPGAFDAGAKEDMTPFLEEMITENSNCQLYQMPCDLAAKVVPFRHKFFAEWASGSTATHPYLAKIKGIAPVGMDKLALVMDHFEEGTLFDYIFLKQLLPVTEKVRLGRQIAEGITALHKEGLAHLDLKATNVCIKKRGDTYDAVVIDFGGAVRLRRYTYTTTEGYEDPQILENIVAKEADTYVHTGRDVWAYGCLLFVMLTQRGFYSAFKGRGSHAEPEDRLAIAKTITDMTYPERKTKFARFLRCWVPPATEIERDTLAHLFASIFTYDPNDRIPMSEIASLLKEI